MPTNLNTARPPDKTRLWTCTLGDFGYFFLMAEDTQFDLRDLESRIKQLGRYL